MPKSSFSSFADIMSKRQAVKAPAYPWQDLALKIIQELGVPGFKRSAVFKVCKDKPAHIVQTALIDTRELCQSGAKWKYFFKIIDNTENK